MNISDKLRTYLTTATAEELRNDAQAIREAQEVNNIPDKYSDLIGSRSICDNGMSMAGVSARSHSMLLGSLATVVAHELAMTVQRPSEKLGIDYGVIMALKNDVTPLVEKLDFSMPEPISMEFGLTPMAARVVDESNRPQNRAERRKSQKKR